MDSVMRENELVALAGALASRGKRSILGITGAPGAGKSTLGERIVSELGPGRAVLVPMDGFHLANSVLLARGLRHVKGAIETFDDAGYASLLERLLAQKAGEVVYAPHFDRGLEEPIAGSIPVLPDIPLVVTEGNYLLAESGAWPRARACLTECWFLEIDRPLRHTRLIDRHVAFGKTREAATAWALGTDEANAALIEAMSHRADRVVRIHVD
ncbi:nucleoside/nucleotide kinase family protein [Sinomonas sp. JGH33]|uniref:Nucleoside/nucleotide kinase family protein n=1 Tax=Sinomonas terricola TaxID=3110330 RepID=A0ABU5T5K8_9MICC|nr:nucleoside/nucleotide kinase family protein [Sinomonas sp. JGH33]MEA5454953.1 nucleoside/nucleotide kinase family protein [Sinomonas sp. JGH33]